MNIQPLLNKLSLGQLETPPVTLNGGALHAVKKITTTTGCYAVKQLNPHITAKKQFKKSYEISERIAEQLKNKAIPAISALCFNKEYVVSMDKQYFMIYPYVQGELLDGEALKPGHVANIGQLYAAIHTSNVQLSGVDKPHYDYFDNDHWAALIQQSGVPDLITLLPNILCWNQAYFSALSHLQKESVITHRDMHPKNVLWDHEQNPHIIDWESAGLMNPILEVVGYGLEWSGLILTGQVNQPFFEVLIQAYRQHHTRDRATSCQTAFYGWLGHCVLAWTEFNIRRMCGAISADETEITKGHDIIVQKMIPCLQYIAIQQTSLLMFIEQCFTNLRVQGSRARLSKI